MKVIQIFISQDGKFYITDWLPYDDDHIDGYEIVASCQTREAAAAALRLLST